MPDFARARRHMVDSQLRPNSVTDLSLLAAFDTVEREAFVPVEARALAYLDSPMHAGSRRLLTPMVLARLIQAARVTRADRVLDVACGLGYSTAVLAQGAGSVVGVESDADLAKRAGAALAAQGVTNATVGQGALTGADLGGEEFDVILVNGAFEVRPAALLARLRQGGRLVGISAIGSAPRAVLYLRHAGDVTERVLFDASAAVLPEFAREPAFVF